MSRLLHAAARGAKIEALDKNLGWILSSHCPLAMSNDTRPYRIHPNDAHLQYGPISTAVRDNAKNPKNLTHVVEALPPYVGYQIGHKTQDELLDVLRCDMLTHSLFLLILAEALADEGM